MNTQTSTSLAPQNISQVTITPEQQNYILSQLLSEKDSVMIRGKRFLNRSGCRKIALYLNINTEVIREERKEIQDGVFIYDFTVRASTPLGRYTEASASCNSTEREFTHLDNDVRATSQTRATNRAICDLIGFYEISELSPPTSEFQAVTETPREEKEAPKEEAMTPKQRYLLIKLIEERYQDEQTRSDLFNTLHGLTKDKARFMIRDLLEENAEM